MAVKTVFERRLEPRFAELERLFMQLYDDRAALEELVDMLRRASHDRPQQLKILDDRRLKEPASYRGGNTLGSTMYTEPHAGSLSGAGQPLE